ncbi:MAG: hypothetical protein ACHQO8_03805 [Vicinamibacterales bacterium]
MLRLVVPVALGALAFAVAPAAISRFQAPVTIDFTADPPPQITAGFYPSEHTPDGLWFAWTRGAFGLSLPTLDRSVAWTVTLRLSGSRPDGTTPDLVTNVDGEVHDRTTLPAGGFVERTLTIEPRPSGGRGLAIAWAVSPTFVPGRGDLRDLGAQVDWIRLAPATGSGPRVVLDKLPLAVWGGAAGAVLGVLALPWLASASLLVLFAVSAGAIITHGLGPFVAFPWLVIGLGAFASAIVTSVALPLRAIGARVAVALTFITVALQLLLLTHPDMPINDAVFHTHRFQDVLGGHYLFASLAPGNYRFPYPIGLYLFALPFSYFTHSTPERMLLLRVIVVVVDASAAALLYRLVVRWRGDDLAGAASVAIYHLLPLSFGVIVTANLTNVFAQSLATMALVAAGSVAAREADGSSPPGARFGPGAGVWLVAALAAAAFLSHTSTFAVLGAQLIFASAALLLSRNDAWKRGGRSLGAAALIAIVLSIAVFYAYFLDVYREAFTRIAAETGHATAAAGGRTPLARLLDVPRGLNLAFGLPAGLLAIGGLVRVLVDRRPSPVGRLIAASLAACLMFLVVGIVTPVDLRHLLAALPLVAMLAAIACADGWRTGGFARIAAIAGFAWMLWVAAVSWMAAISS